jgi:2-dehydro-3-deoxyphosphogluconate aldolase/(4S)-4-hydroxy-2-oxoglutarate aldolase
MTPTDIQNALSAGLRVVKFFPALQAGGLPMLNALAAPHASLGLRFIPTGGVTLETVASWLEQKSVLAVGGTWIATKDMIASGAWDAIRRNAAAASDVVARLRP